MSLPPELIDRVLKSLRDDTQSLLATSLVSKTWASWSQYYLFESVHLSPRNIKRWLKNLSPDIDTLASRTRTLTLEEFRLLPWINPQNLDFPPSTLASFRDVRSLSLVQWNATLFHGASAEPYFGHFGRSLHALSLRFCTLDPGTLFNFFSLLPNVQDLEIAYLFPYFGESDTTPDVPEVTPSFCGTLTLADLGSGHHILKTVAALPLHFTNISIRGCTFYDPSAYQMLLTSCRDTLVVLRFERSYRDRPVPDVSLASCNKLEEVHALLLSNKKLTRPSVDLLSSVTSQKLRKISLSFIEFIGEGEPKSDEEDEDDWDDGDNGTEIWGLLDTALGRLAEQVSGAEVKLTLQLNIRYPGSKPVKLDHPLSKFLEYGELDVNYT